MAALRGAEASARPGDRLASNIRVSLLSSFELSCDGTTVGLPVGIQRLVAFLALHDHPMLRVYVAGALWLDAPEERAAASLRSSLWRLNQPGFKVVGGSNGRIELAREVTVDLRDSTALAQALLSGSDGCDDPAGITRALSGDVLPDWYDEWAVMERERFRQLRLHALEALGERLLAEGKVGQAIEAAQAAAVAEPLRESAHRLLVRIHLVEGNPGEAIRQYRLCERLFREQLGVTPSGRMRALVEPLTT
ncbi:MAG TPA: BTAD domain-containing putative transcriptional regulator [Actinomycetota bacterium]|jgi:DNA-binding SARP family transcriptional activator